MSKCRALSPLAIFRSLFRVLLTSIFIFSLSNVAWANSQLDQALLTKLTTAQKRLSTTEKNIATQRSKLATQLNVLEQQVLALRDKTAAARRLNDEKTLSLTQLETRLKQWRDQQVYQQNIIKHFLQKHTLTSPLNPANSALTVAEQMNIISTFTSEIQMGLTPQWQSKNIIMPSGKQETLDTLSIGPMHWFWLDAKQQAGLAKLTDGQLHSSLLLATSASQGINELHQSGVGSVIFDPTMDRALARQQHSETPWQHLLKGGVWVIPIVIFALLALTIALYKSFQLLRLPSVIHLPPNSVSSLVTQNDSPLLDSLKGKQRQLVDIAKSTESERAREDLLFVQLQQDKHGLEKWLMVIGVTASIAPLLGLLGTVSGMIETFKMMTLFGSGDPEVVSGGIAQALITTELGLVVAIPALLLNAILSKKVKSYYLSLENFAILLTQTSDIQANNDKTHQLQQVAV